MADTLAESVAETSAALAKVDALTRRVRYADTMALPDELHQDDIDGIVDLQVKLGEFAIFLADLADHLDPPPA